MRNDGASGDGSGGGRDRRPGQNPLAPDATKKLTYKRVRVADLLNETPPSSSSSTLTPGRPHSHPDTSGGPGSSGPGQVRPPPPPLTHQQGHPLGFHHSHMHLGHQSQEHHPHHGHPHGTSHLHRGQPVPSLASSTAPVDRPSHAHSSGPDATSSDRHLGHASGRRGMSAPTCPECKRSFQTRKLLNEHRRQEHPRSDLTCNHCHSSFFDRGNLNKHVSIPDECCGLKL
jgi:hypothetical protein